MKSFHASIWTVLLLFFLIMGGVAFHALTKKSHATGIDPARIREIRELARKEAK